MNLIEIVLVLITYIIIAITIGKILKRKSNNI